MVQAMVTPQLLHQNRRTIVGSPALVIEGRLQKRDGSLSIRAERLWPLESVDPPPQPRFSLTQRFSRSRAPTTEIHQSIFRNERFPSARKFSMNRHFAGQTALRHCATLPPLAFRRCYLSPGLTGLAISEPREVSMGLATGVRLFRRSRRSSTRGILIKTALAATLLIAVIVVGATPVKETPAVTARPALLTEVRSVVVDGRGSGAADRFGAAR